MNRWSICHGLGWLAFFCFLIGSTAFASKDHAVLDYRLDYKTVKKSVTLNGWREFTTPAGEPPVFYLEGVYSGSARSMFFDCDIGYVDYFAGGGGSDWGPDSRFKWGQEGVIPGQNMGGYFTSSGNFGSLSAALTVFKNVAITDDVFASEVAEPPVLSVPGYVGSGRASASVYIEDLSDSGSPIETPNGPIYNYIFYYENINFSFENPEHEDAAEARTEEIIIYPNPPPPPAPQPSSYDVSMVGASFRQSRTDRYYDRYSSQFNLKLKLCPGEYLLKWRVEGKHKDDMGAPQPYPQERNITIDENTQLDAEGYYDLGWIDIAQQLTPDYIYRLASYEEGATPLFHLEPKDECGCAKLGSGSGGVSFGSVNAWFDLGKDLSGKSGGFIKLHAENIESITHLPQALKVVQGDSTSARFVYNDEGVLRQAQSDRRIIDIVPLVAPAEGYQLRFYNASDATGWIAGKFRTFEAIGITPAATPFVVWKVKRLADADGFKRIEVTRSEGGTDFIHVFSQDLTTPSTWNFSEASGLRTTTRVESSAPSGDVYRTTTLSDPTYGTGSVKRERVKTFVWGEKVIEETLDPSGTNPLTTSYEYYTSGVGLGQIWKTNGPDGTVTENIYEAYGSGFGVTTSRIAGITVTYPNGRVQTTTHGTLASLSGSSADNVNSLVTTAEAFGGTLIQRTWQIGYAAPVAINGVNYQESRSIRAAATTAEWNDSRNQVTITRVASTPTGRLRVTLSPDGKVSRTHHGLPDSQGRYVITTETGLADANGTGLLAGTGGTRTLRAIDALGRTVETTTTDVESGLVTALELVTDWSSTNNELATHISHYDGSEELRNYSTCCGKLESVTRHGQTISYTYDHLGRQETITQDGLTTRTYYDAADRVRKVVVYPPGSPGSFKLVSSSVYDPAGRLTATTTPYGIGQTVTTTVAETVNSTTGVSTQVTTHPSDTNLLAGVVTAIKAADGSPLQVTGNATAPVAYSYDADSLADASAWGYSASDRFFKTTETKLDADGEPTSETTTTYQDALGRTIKVAYLDGAAVRRFYDTAGRLEKAVDPDGVTTLYAYTTGSFGEKTTVAIDLAATVGGSRNGTIDYAGGYDRVTETTTRIAQHGSTTVRRTKVEIWQNGTAPTEVSVDETSMDGLKSWHTVAGTLATETTVDLEADGIRTETTLFPDNTENSKIFIGGRLMIVARKNSEGNIITAVNNQYDDYGRLEASNLTGIGTTSYTYFDDGQIESIITPDPDSTRTGAGYDPQTTTYAYNKRGWQSKVTHPDDTETETTYWPTGQVKRTWGSRTYPVEYSYDPQGRVKTMTTWRDFFGTAGAAVTTWNYSPTRGWLDNKRDDDNKGPGYTYTAAGRLKTRTWQRGVATTYGYTNAGDLHTVTYSDGTPSVAHTYYRDGRNHTTTDAAGLLTRTYTTTVKLDDEVYSGSALLNGLSVLRAYDTLDRLESLTATGAAAVGYGYDHSSQLKTITQGTHVATVGYKPNAGTVQSITVAVSGTERTKLERITDTLGRVKQVDTTGNGTTLHARRVYTYNDANQRTRVEHEDARRWAYGYDALGQVTSAEKRLTDDTTVLPGYRFGYAFDDIGNRTSTMINDRTTTYTPNDLNQYAQRQIAGAVDVRGSASAGVAVVVNDLLAARTETDFFKAVPVTNASTAVNAAIKVQAVKVSPEQVATENRTAFVAKTPEVFGHDDDGNLRTDGRWTYTWDGENRLSAMETLPVVATVIPALKQRLEFSYDGQGRRIAKTVKTWNAGTSTWAVQTDVRFLYDGWNLVGEYLASGYTPVQLPVWGLDLSGSSQGAGGVGGLLWVTKSTATHIPGYDGNGNVIAWLDSSNGALVGELEYGPFGEPVLATGVAATQSYGFSSKYLDAETGLLYYGLRYYNPSTGRWVNRDPSEERGGVNLYGMVRNDAVNWVDYLGLEGLTNVPPEGTYILRLARGIQYNDEQAKRAFVPYDSSRGGYFGDGFEVEYQPAKTCPCAKQNIRLVQAIKSGWQDSQIDAPDSSFAGNASTPGGTPLPGYVQAGGRKGSHGSTSYYDAPYDPWSNFLDFKKGRRYQFEVCALCPSGTVLGCFKFEIYNNERIPRPTGSSPASAPGDLWNSAVERWDKASGPKTSTSIKYTGQL